MNPGKLHWADLKESAKAHRDAGRFDNAIADLESAIAQLKGEVGGENQEPISEVNRKVARQLGDLSGMLGGVHRRWAKRLRDEARRDEDESRRNPSGETSIQLALMKKSEARKQLESALKAYRT